MNFVFKNLLGAPYRGGTLVIHNNELFIPVGNRVGQVSLTESTTHCFPFENLTQIRVICLSPVGGLLLSVDKDGRALLINWKRKVLLHHFSFKGPVACAKFSPDGSYLAVGVGRLVQVWLSPSLDKQINPMQLYRTYGQCHSDVLDLDWSPPCQGSPASGPPLYFIAAGCRDGTLRVFSLDPIPGYDPPCLGGHKDGVLGVMFASEEMRSRSGSSRLPLPPGGPLMYSVSADGALHCWTYGAPETAAAAGNPFGNLEHHVAARRRAAVLQRRQGEQSVELSGGQQRQEGEERGEEEEEGERERKRRRQGGGKWYLSAKHYVAASAAARVTCCSLHPPSGTLALGFSTGLFEVHQLVPEPTRLHTLSISRERITSLSFNHTGDWLAVGCARLGQLLVWEWRSESYVLKQQAHQQDLTAAAFSPDGAMIATGGEDCKVKVFQQSTGFCFVTFSEHTAPVTAVTFLPSGAVLLSASLDGSVRAWDLVRYRNFRTLTSPTPAQYGSLAVDPGGEVVVAGAVDTFQIYVWSLRTGRLLDVLSGHEGPITGLAFSPVTSLLASASWDRTVRMWDVYDSGGSGSSDVLDHRHDVLAIAMRADGRQLAAATADGSIYLWDPVEGELQGTIEGRRDIRGPRLASDRRTAANSSAGAAFTSLSYSADGAWLLAGGRAKYICVYDVKERLLLRRIQLSHNRSLDGVLDCLNTKDMTDAGPLQLINRDDLDEALDLMPPATDLAATADLTGTATGKRPALRCRCVALSPTGRAWAAATTEGLILYGTDEGLIFDPTDLEQDVTPGAVHSSLAAGAHLRALLIALRLGDQELVRHVLLMTPPGAVKTTVAGLPAVFVPAMLGTLAECAAQCPHVEFVLAWIRTLCTAHGPLLKAAAAGSVGGAAPAVRVASGSGGAPAAAALMAVLRSLQKVFGSLHGALSAAAESNMYSLEYLTTMSMSSAAPTAAIRETGDDGGDVWRV
uniref:UTP1f n=1 Tax=Volvox carteri f. nagariensis TaxID=3068 RepID=D9CJ26_VOLCA|nr:UTP1f [Volvox carteri f. nagariensis]